MQEREAEAKHHEMEAARREAAEKAREYEGVRAEVPLLLMPEPAMTESTRAFPGVRASPKRSIASTAE